MTPETDSKKRALALFELNGRPPFRVALPIALQHVIAMIVGCVTPAIIIAGVAHLSPADSVILIQASLIAAAIGTALQLFPIGPRSLGSSGRGTACYFWRQFCLCAEHAGYYRRIRYRSDFWCPGRRWPCRYPGGTLHPPDPPFLSASRSRNRCLYSGVVTISNCYKLHGRRYRSAYIRPVAELGRSSVYAGCGHVFTHFGRGSLKLASILVGMGAGYVLALILGMVDFTNVANAGYFEVPRIMHFGIEFDVSAIVAIAICLSSIPSRLSVIFRLLRQGP